jgi:hypothetical protein
MINIAILLMISQTNSGFEAQRNCLKSIYYAQHGDAWKATKWLYYYRNTQPSVDENLAKVFVGLGLPKEPFRNEFLCTALRGSRDPTFQAYFKKLLSGKNRDLQVASFRALYATRDKKTKEEAIARLKSRNGKIDSIFQSVIKSYDNTKFVRPKPPESR